MSRPRLLFASIHGYLDPSGGAAICTREMLELLAARGWDCRSLTCGVLDYQRETTVDELLASLGLDGSARRLERRSAEAGPRQSSTWRSAASASQCCPRPPAGPTARPTRARARVPRPRRAGPQTVPARCPADLRRTPRLPGADATGARDRHARRLPPAQLRLQRPPRVRRCLGDHLPLGVSRGGSTGIGSAWTGP